MAKVLMQPSASFLKPSSAASSITTLPRWREHQNGAIVVVLAGDDTCSSRFLALAAAADGPLAGVDEARVHVEKPRSRPLADLLTAQWRNKDCASASHTRSSALALARPTTTRLMSAFNLDRKQCHGTFCGQP